MPGQTGPKTPEGKAKYSKNAIKHGLTCNRMYVLSNEDQPRWNNLVQTWIDKLQPKDDAELCIVTDIAHAEWRLRRARTWESGLLDYEMDEQAESMAALFDGEDVDEGYRQSEAFKALAKTPALTQLHRYETRVRRAFKNGLAALKELRALAAAAAEPALPAEPAPAGGKTAVLKPARAPKSEPRPDRKLRPAAANTVPPQRLAPENKKRQNEMPRHCRPHVPSPRRHAFGTRRTVKISFGRRSKRR